jgi:hypothetical protein
MKLLLVIILVALSITLSTAVNLECEFKLFDASYGELYTCVSEDLETIDDDNLVTDVCGNHINGKNDKDVKQFYVFNQSVEYFPGGLSSKFPNLESIVVKNSSLHFLFKTDLFELSNLKYFDVSGNEIEILSPRLFEDNADLMEVHFEDNKISSISNDLLDPMVDLKVLKLFNNICVQKDSDIKSFLSNANDIKKKLQEKCPISEEDLAEISSKQVENLVSHIKVLEEKLEDEKNTKKTSNSPLNNGEDDKESEGFNRKIEKLEYEKMLLEINTDLTNQTLEENYVELNNLREENAKLKTANAKLDAVLKDTLTKTENIEAKLKLTNEEMKTEVLKLQTELKTTLIEKKAIESKSKSLQNINRELNKKITVQSANNAYYDRLEEKFKKESSQRKKI